MLAKGDLKFRLNGKKLKGDFALVKMKGRRPGSKGNEWLMIKKHDEYVVEGYDIEAYRRVGAEQAQPGGDCRAMRDRRSGRAVLLGRGKLKAAWLADAVAKLDKKKAAASGQKKKQKPLTSAEDAEVNKRQAPETSEQIPPPLPAPAKTKQSKSSASSAVSVSDLDGAVKQPMPSTIHPMLATPVDEPFDGAEWLFEIKWDGYRAIAFIDDGKLAAGFAKSE